MDYYQKYLKYKAKYLELKKQLEGGDKCDDKECDMTKNWCKPEKMDDQGKIKSFTCTKLLGLDEKCYIGTQCLTKICDSTKKCVASSNDY